jgi:uncharacterized integral membrane protein
MRIRTLPVLLLLVLVGLFALFNWGAVTTPVPVSLFFGTATLPLGLVLVGVIALLGAMYLATVIYLQGTALLDGRRLTKELQSQRDLADKAEASRFTELRDHLSAELFKLNDAAGRHRTELLARIDRLEAQQRRLMEEQVNGLEAHLGHLDERLRSTSARRADTDVLDDGARLRRGGVDRGVDDGLAGDPGLGADFTPRRTR